MKPKTGIDIESLFSGEVSTPRHEEYRRQLIELFGADESFLPPAESTLGRLWSLIQSSESPIGECAEVVLLDPALTVRVMRIANSATYRSNAATVQDAILHLGLANLRQIVFTDHVFSEFSRLTLPAGWDVFWMRNILVARLAERVASFYFRPNGTEYLSGMLHDIGWLLLYAYFPEELEAILQGPRTHEEAEVDVLSFSHSDISAIVCAKSNIAMRVVNAVRYHHRPFLLPTRDFQPAESAAFLGVILFLCDRLADAACLPLGGGREPLAPEAVLQGEEIAWLAGFGPTPDFLAITQEELGQAQHLLAALSEGRN